MPHPTETKQPITGNSSAPSSTPEHDARITSLREILYIYGMCAISDFSSYFVTKKMLPNLVVIVIFFRSIFSILHYSRIFIFHYKNDLIKTAQEHPEMGYRQVGNASFY